QLRPMPGALHYWLIHVFMYVLPVEIAGKVFLSLYLILFPLSVLTLARTLGRSPWLALGAFPLAFNRNWAYGYGGYLFSPCLALVALSALLRFLDDGRQRSLTIFLLTATACLLAHPVQWMVLTVAALVLVVRHRQPGRRAASALLALAPSVLYFVAIVAAE